MKNQKVSLFTKFVLGSLSGGSLYLIGNGLYQHGWWAGFGLIMFMTSLVGWVGFINSIHSIVIPKTEEKSFQKAA